MALQGILFLLVTFLVLTLIVTGLVSIFSRRWKLRLFIAIPVGLLLTVGIYYGIVALAEREQARKTLESEAQVQSDAIEQLLQEQAPASATEEQSEDIDIAFVVDRSQEVITEVNSPFPYAYSFSWKEESPMPRGQYRTWYFDDNFQLVAIYFSADDDDEYYHKGWHRSDEANTVALTADTVGELEDMWITVMKIGLYPNSDGVRMHYTRDATQEHQDVSTPEKPDEVELIRNKPPIEVNHRENERLEDYFSEVLTRRESVHFENGKAILSEDYRRKVSMHTELTFTTTYVMDSVLYVWMMDRL